MSRVGHTEGSTLSTLHPTSDDALLQNPCLVTVPKKCTLMEREWQHNQSAHNILKRHSVSAGTLAHLADKLTQ